MSAMGARATIGFGSDFQSSMGSILAENEGESKGREGGRNRFEPIDKLRNVCDYSVLPVYFGQGLATEVDYERGR